MPHRPFTPLLLILALGPLTGCERNLVQDPVSDEDVAAAQTSGSDSSPSGTGAAAIVAQAGSGGDDASSTSSGAGEGGTLGAGGVASGGYGGEGGDGPHTITVALRPIPSDANLTGRLVLVNALDGSLRQTLQAGELPVDIEVVDGDLVSFLELPTAPYWRSFRVTPELTRIELEVERYAYVEDEPMEVTIILPEGASRYVVHSESGHFAFDLPPGPHTFQVDGTHHDPLRVLVEAVDSTATLAYSVFEIAYEPGATLTITPEMRVERAAFDVDVTSLEGAESVHATSYWWLRLLQGPGEGEHLKSPPVAWSYSGSVIAPEVEGGRKLQIAVMFPEVDGLCAKAFLEHEGPGNTRLGFDVDALRAPAFAGELFALAEPGGFGNRVTRHFEYRSADGAHDTIYWYIYEDPLRPPLPVVFLELPADAPPIVFPEAGSFIAAGLAHTESGYSSYAAFAADAADEGSGVTRRSRTLGACD